MINFEGQNAQEFYLRFNSVDPCREYLSEIKWKGGFKCVKCGHVRCQVRANYNRTCNRCSHTESPSANTLFHKVKFGLDKAFIICFEMATTTRGLSASYLAKRLGITPYTARMFMYKVRDAMMSSGNIPIDNRVEVDEFVVGGKRMARWEGATTPRKRKLWLPWS